MSEIKSVHAVAIGFTRILDKPKSFTEIGEFIIKAEKDVKKKYPHLTVSIQWEGGQFLIGNYDSPDPLTPLTVELHQR